MYLATFTGKKASPVGRETHIHIHIRTHTRHIRQERRPPELARQQATLRRKGAETKRKSGCYNNFLHVSFLCQSTTPEAAYGQTS